MVRALLSSLVLLALTSCQAPSSDQAPALNRNEMQSEIAEALKISSMSKRFIAIGALLNSITPENAPGAGEAYAANLYGVRSCEMRPFAHAWASVDADAAVEYSLNLTTSGGQRRREAISESVRAWTAQDRGAGAKVFLAGLDPSSDDYRVVINNTVIGLAEGGYPSEATPLLASLNPDETREMLIFKLMLELFRTDYTQVRAWVDSIPEDAANELKITAFERAMALGMTIDPQSALGWYEEHQFTDYAGTEAIATILKAYVETSPSEALAWLIQLPPSQARSDAVRDAAYTWLKTAPDDASPFLRANLNRPEMVTAIFPYAQFMIKEDWVEAVEWARRVPIPFERARVLSQALVVWGHRDRPAVIEWLKEHPEVDEPIFEAVTDQLKVKPQELS